MLSNELVWNARQYGRQEAYNDHAVSAAEGRFLSIHAIKLAATRAAKRYSDDAYIQAVVRLEYYERYLRG